MAKAGEFRLICPEVTVWLPISEDDDEKNEKLLDDVVLPAFDSAICAFRNKLKEEGMETVRVEWET
jgi:hypothetical protein